MFNNLNNLLPSWAGGGPPNRRASMPPPAPTQSTPQPRATQQPAMSSAMGMLNTAINHWNTAMEEPAQRPLVPERRSAPADMTIVTGGVIRNTMNSGTQNTRDAFGRSQFGGSSSSQRNPSQSQRATSALQSRTSFDEASESKGDPNVPVEIILVKKLVLLHTILPWCVFVCTYLIVTFGPPSMETFPWFFTALLLLLSALTVLPIHPPGHKFTKIYRREDVVTCTAFLMTTGTFAFLFRTCWAGLGYFALVGMAFMTVSVGEVRFRKIKRKSWVNEMPFICCLIGAATGALLGYYNYSEHMLAYHHITGGVEYTNVLPGSKSEAYADFGKLIFAPESRIEDTKSAGYQPNPKMTEIFCAAPILETDQTEVEFWLVGKDCCSPQGSFWCTASTAYESFGTKIASGHWDADEKLQHEEFWNIQNEKGVIKGAVPFIERPFAVGWDKYAMKDKDGFYKARKKVMKIFNLNQAHKPRLIFLTSNPMRVAHHLLSGAWIMFAMHALLWFAISLTTGFIGSFDDKKRGMQRMQIGNPNP